MQKFPCLLHLKVKNKIGLSFTIIDGKGENESRKIENDEIRARNSQKNKIVLMSD